MSLQEDAEPYARQEPRLYESERRMLAAAMEAVERIRIGLVISGLDDVVNVDYLDEFIEAIDPELFRT